MNCEGVRDVADEYLIDVDGQLRESEVLWRFCDMPFMLDELLVPLGLPAGLYWVTRGVPHGELVAGRKGDVDLVVGRLAFEDLKALEPLRIKYQSDAPELPEGQHIYFALREHAAAGRLQWPPPMDHLVAIEAKCAYFSAVQSRVMSTKSSQSKVREVRAQIDELFEMVPFNRVALLDFIINPPAAGENGAAWLNAAAIAASAIEKMRGTLEARLPSDSSAGHFVMSWGAVHGGTELWRGAGNPLQLRAAADNPRLRESDVQERRRELEGNLRRILAQRPRPLCFPAIL